jgi:poly-gamma-glutamate capsule biosynthesis protein CapA/YwtB (metallophosphatase superfamily)
MNLLLKGLQGALIVALLAVSACTREKEDYSLLLGGDVMLARAGQLLFPMEDPSPWGDFIDIRSHFPEAVFAANLESPLGLAAGSQPGDMNLCALPESIELLKQVDLNLVTFANNHGSDCAQAGEDQTVNTLEHNGIEGQNSTVETIYRLSSGIEISFIAIDAYSQPVDVPVISHLISHSKAAERLVVASIHWGMEYQAGPTPDQEALAARLVDAGADILWGHHPHVLQRMEWMTSTVDGHQALVIYSLGNLFSDQWAVPDALKEAIIHVQIRNGQIVGVELIPLVLDRGEDRLRLASGEANTWIGERLKFNQLEKKGISVKTWGQEAP